MHVQRCMGLKTKGCAQVCYVMQEVDMALLLRKGRGLGTLGRNICCLLAVQARPPAPVLQAACLDAAGAATCWLCRHVRFHQSVACCFSCCCGGTLLTVKRAQLPCMCRLRVGHGVCCSLQAALISMYLRITCGHFGDALFVAACWLCAPARLPTDCRAH